MVINIQDTSQGDGAKEGNRTSDMETAGLGKKQTRHKTGHGIKVGNDLLFSQVLNWITNQFRI